MDIEKFLKLLWNIFWVVFIIVSILWYFQNREILYPGQKGLLDEIIKNIYSEIKI